MLHKRCVGVCVCIHIYIYRDMCCFCAVPTWQLTSVGLDKGDDGGGNIRFIRVYLLAFLLT